MPYIFQHHVRRLGVWGLGFVLLVGVGCKSTGDESSWKFPKPSWMNKKPAASAEASSSDAPIVTPPPGLGPIGSAAPRQDHSTLAGAEARARLFGGRTDSQVVLTSGIESESTVRTPGAGEAHPVPFASRGVTVIGTRPTVAKLAPIPTPPDAVVIPPVEQSVAAAASPARHHSLWIDPFTEAEVIPEPTAPPAVASLEPSSHSSSRRDRDGQTSPTATNHVAAKRPVSVPMHAAASQGHDWAVMEPIEVESAPLMAGARTVAPAATNSGAIPVTNPLMAMVARANARPGYVGLDAPLPSPAPMTPTPTNPPPALATFIPPPPAPAGPVGPNDTPAPSLAAPTQVAELTPITPIDQPTEPSATAAAPHLTSQAAALLRPEECRQAPAQVDPVVALLAKSQQKFAKVRNYEARMSWKHSGDKASTPSHAVQLTCRTEPRAIRVDFAAADEAKKWLYTESPGESSLMQAEATSLGRMVMAVSPESEQARALHRRPVNEWGLESLLIELQNAVVLRDAGAANVSYVGKVWREDCRANLDQVTVSFPGRAGQIEYYFDPATSLPAMVVSRDSKGSIREFERYADVKVNVGALDAPLAFDADAILRR